MRRQGGLGPSGVHATDDHQIFKDHRKVRSATVGAQHAVFFQQRSLPHDLAGLSIQTLKQATDAQLINLIGFGIGNRAGPTDAFGRRIAQENIVNIFPNQLTRLRIKANSLFTFFGRFGERTTNRVHPAVHRNGRRTSGKLLFAPQQVVSLGRPIIWQVRLVCMAVHGRTTPVCPITWPGWLVALGRTGEGRHDHKRRGGDHECRLATQCTAASMRP